MGLHLCSMFLEYTTLPCCTVLCSISCFLGSWLPARLTLLSHFPAPFVYYLLFSRFEWRAHKTKTETWGPRAHEAKKQNHKTKENTLDPLSPWGPPGTIICISGPPQQWHGHPRSHLANWNNHKIRAHLAAFDSFPSSVLFTISRFGQHLHNTKKETPEFVTQDCWGAQNKV